MFAGTAHAHAAGVSKGGLLCHFASKDGLLAGMVERRIDRPPGSDAPPISAGAS
jgi:AcrR family transcriptional regulator